MFSMLAFQSETVRRAAFVLTLGFVAACSSQTSSNPSLIHDTTGAVYGWRCSDTECLIASVDGTPPLPACGSGTFWGYFISRFITVCPGTPTGGGGWVTEPELCRIVSCGTTTDCPQWQGKAYECRSGLCQAQGTTGNRYDPSDVVDLCLADAPRAADCDPTPATPTDPAIQQAEALALASCSAGGGDAGATQRGCSVPASCRQP
jgi:hypothetical protein